MRLGNDPDRYDQSTGLVVFVLFVRRLPGEGKVGLQGPAHSGSDPGRIVLTNLKQRVLAPDRIAEFLKSLIERQAAKSEAADDRLLALQKGIERLRGSPEATLPFD
jgi:hypothetical protein